MSTFAYHLWCIRGPGGWLETWTVCETKQGCINIWRTRRPKPFDPRAWGRAYRKGWRCARVTLAEHQPREGAEGRVG